MFEKLTLAEQEKLIPEIGARLRLINGLRSVAIFVPQKEPPPAYSPEYQ
jgi:hypothetical protein